MTAKIMDGKSVSEEIRNDLKKRAEALCSKGTQARLDIILVGENPASKIYVEKKIKASGETWIKAELHKFPESAKQGEIIGMIEKLNSDKSVHGILVQLPLPKHINEQDVLDSICPEKDVDGLTTYNLGNLFAGRAKFEPCTPKGIMKMLDHEKIGIEGRDVVVVGRSNIVGKPISMMMLKRNGTVTVCHSKTKDLKTHSRNADILVVAVGKAKLITEDMVKEGAVIVDVGMNRTEDGLCGDVDFEKVKEKVSYITPVPGGVGPLTVAMVLENTVISAERRLRI